MRIRPILLLLSLIILSIAAYYYLQSLDHRQPEKVQLTEKEKREIAEFEKQIEKDSIEFANRYKHKNYHSQNNYNSSGEDFIPEYFPFDPNTTDSITFLRLGLKPWQAHNAMQYRRHNGRWRKPDAFLKLYGLSQQQKEILRPYIVINKNAEEIQWEQAKRRRDSIRALLPQKFSSGTVVPLNTADTTMLKRIPGIGSYYASKIVNYRNRLGGFVSVEQITEIDGLPDGIEKWFKIEEPSRPLKLKINHADFKTLVRHPYLNYEQVKFITNRIRLYGPLKGFDDLKLSKDFSQEDFKRLQPYIDFQK